jgi:hypothetical protein
MCPACLSTLALIAAGTGATGGLTALVVTKLRGRNDTKNPEPPARAEAPERKEESR